MKQVTVIKVGGAVVEDKAQLAALLDQFQLIEGPKVLVHGGGRAATRIAQQMGVETHMIDGRRVTDEAMLDIVTMVYGGLVNKQIVAELQARGLKALGLTGADLDVIRSHRRPVTDKGVDYGWVGDVDRADGEMLLHLLNSGITPVIAPLTHDGQGHMLNTNADTMASTVACALAPLASTTLTFAFEKPGVMRDPDDDASVIQSITAVDYAQLKAEGVVSGGMIPKLDNAFASIAKGVQRVVITQAADLQGLRGTTLH